MNLTDLQLELRDIEKRLVFLHSEIDKMKPKSEEEKKAIFAAVDRLAANNPIDNQGISAMPEPYRKTFFRSLSNILLSSERDIYVRLLYLTRLSLGCGMGWSAEEIYKAGLEAVDIDMLIREMGEYKDTFLVEIILAASLNGQADEKIYSMIAGIAEVLGCDPEELQVIAQVAKCSLLDNPDLLLDIPASMKNRWMHRFWNYIPYKWIVKNRKKVGFKNAVNRGGGNEKLDAIISRVIKEKVQSGSLVRAGDIIFKYTQKSRRETDRNSMLYLFGQLTTVIEEEKVMKAPCDGIIFFINDNENEEISAELDENIVAYIVSYFDDYSCFKAWLRDEKKENRYGVFRVE